MADNRPSASELLKKYQKKEHKHLEEEAEEDLMYAKLFAMRSPHLPGNGWCSDWIMWFMNNHPLLALFCRDRRNPVGLYPRLVVLLSSISYGLIATNLIYLYYRTNPGSNVVLLRFKYGEIDSEGNQDFIDLSYESITVFTLGGISHSIFDLLIWHLNACSCCVNSIFAKIGPAVSMIVGFAMCGASLIVVLWRLTYEDHQIEGYIHEDKNVGEIEGNNNWMDMEIGMPHSIGSFQFLFSFYSELFSVWFVSFPLIGTLTFSGALRKVTRNLIGGRPKEIDRQNEEARRKAAGIEVKDTEGNVQEFV